MYIQVKKIILAFLMFGLASTVLADDLDIINAEAQAVDANILFIMDVSGSMEFDATSNIVAADPANSRMTILRSALGTLLSDPKMKDINVGLSSFAGDTTVSTFSQTAHGISYPVSSIDADAETILDQNPLFDHPGTSFLPPTTSGEITRDYLQTISNTWVPYGGTPIVDALFEASLYFRGLPTNWGRHDPSKIRAAHPSTYVGLLQDVTTSTTAYQCNSVACSGSSCNATSTCTTAPQTSNCSTPTCGTTCTGPTTIRESCGTNTSCGNGANCTSATTTYTRDCITNSELLCRIVHPTWYACNSVTSTSCTTTCPDGIVDEFGVCVNPVTDCSNSTHKQCKEDVDTYSCDADNYQCTTDVQSCVHDECGNATTNTTTLTGTATFVSPITKECPANGIILLSDGLPSANLSSTLVSNMIGPSYNNNCDTGTDYGRCGPELASFLANEDNNSTVTGDQPVKTFTVGLSLFDPSAKAYLEKLAKAGDGVYVNASSAGDLVVAFKDAIASIADSKARTFSAPSYTIDTSTLLSHGEYVYLPLFDRSGTVWPGNLKKYKLVDGVLTDKDGNAAMDASGSLIKTAKDYWASAASTDVIESGGAANKVNPADRIAGSMFTDTGSTLTSLSTSISNAQFGLSTSAADTTLKADLIQYISGVNPVDNTPRNHMGDIVHSKPIQLTLASGRRVIFVGSNEGFLHAINDADGSEAFTYMPSELLPNIKKQYDSLASAEHIYGVDGPITLWIDESYNTDASNTGAIGTNVGNGILDNNEKAYLFFGLRRGGKSYHALNVTDPGNPVLVWKKSFGMGDSWSQPVLAPLKWKPNAKPKQVLIFGGGFNDDTSGNELAGGNGVYIVNALTGAEVWSTKTAELNPTLSPDGAIAKAVPSRIRVLDVDRNGSVDRLYFGDTGGNIWRVDLNASDYSGVASQASNIKKAELHKFAELGGSGADNRKFFEEPDVAIFKQAGKLVASIAIGSGDRANPLDATVNDNFFVLYDKEVLSLPTATKITKTILKTPPVSLADMSDPSYKGWYKSLTSNTGEKVLSTAVTYQNKVLFTTFGTTSVTPDACNPSNVNEARLYIIDLQTGVEDKNIVAASGEILGTPHIVFEDLKAKDGSACVKGDCIRKAVVRIGKADPIDLPPVPPGVTPPDSLPRVYWIDNQ